MRYNDKRTSGNRSMVDVQPFQDCLPQAVYWLGYLYTNTSILEPWEGHYWLNTTCSTNEETTLVHLAGYLNVLPTLIHTKNGNYASLRIRDTTFTNFCMSIGITRYKKDRGRVSKPYCGLRPFWRGVVDGSGRMVDGNVLRVRGNRLMATSFNDHCYQDIPGCEEYVVQWDAVTGEMVVVDGIRYVLSALYEGVATTDIPLELRQHIPHTTTK